MLQKGGKIIKNLFVFIPKYFGFKEEESAILKDIKNNNEIIRAGYS